MYLYIFEKIFEFGLNCFNDFVFDNWKLILNGLGKFELFDLVQMSVLNLAHDFQRRVVLSFCHHLLNATELA